MQNPLRTVLLVAVAAALAGPATARAAVTLDLFALLAYEDDSGWRLVAELEGSNEITTATLTPPARPAFALACGASSERTECEFESSEAASLAELLTAYPSGQWTLSLNGGTRSATLGFAPVAPDGLVTVTSPADGAADVSPTPTIAWVHDCSNCVALSFDLVDVAGAFPIGLEVFVAGSPPPSPGSLAYDALESYRGPKPAALPDGSYALAAATVVGSVTNRNLTPGGDAFEYSSGALRATESRFTVPEPAAPAATAAALGLATIARRRRRRAAPAQRAAATSPSSMSIQPSRA